MCANIHTTSHNNHNKSCAPQHQYKEEEPQGKPTPLHLCFLLASAFILPRIFSFIVKATTATMGCLNSKAADGNLANSVRDTSMTNNNQQPLRETQGKPPITASTLVADPTATGADASGQVLSVPRSAVTVGDKERAELKLKNLRDTFEQSIERSETLLKDEGKLALEFKKQGRDASARILIRRRKMLKDKINKAENMLQTVSNMIGGMEVAHDNRRLIDALDKGSKAIHEIHNEVSIDTVHSVMNDHRQALAYVQQVNDVIGDGAKQSQNHVDDKDYEETMKLLSEELGTNEHDKDNQVDNINVNQKMPDLPTSKVPHHPNATTNTTSHDDNTTITSHPSSNTSNLESAQLV